jgi:hypothetical protein
MHPRTARSVWPGALGARRRGAGVRARTRRGAPARGRRAVRAWQDAQLVRRQRATPAPSCSTACTTAACCAWRGARAARAVYAARARRRRRPTPTAALDALVDVVLAKYAPLPERRWASWCAPALRRAAVARRAPRPRCSAPRRGCRQARSTACAGLAGGREPGVAPRTADDRLRLLAPFDPVVWDRRRFELLWGWAYRFEAYTPAPSACAATTRCRCCGATGSSAGATWAGATGACGGSRLRTAAAADRGLAPPLDDELSRCASLPGAGRGAVRWRAQPR